MTTVANPEEKRVQISFRAPVSRRQQIRIDAACLGLTPQEWLDNLVIRELEERSKKNPQIQAAQ
ncbi:hypothetical protein [Acinetobacter dispersus]|uniref:hypothetical protein n=1 Tax=Acinetobacter dispersus TaxID=70348 RepID=UPI00132EFCE4|nr:hypothetical protein [Acinetobacter dispersus]QHH99214.1 hypothetical protein FPL17_17365 [Acinetobacter dispersus]